MKSVKYVVYGQQFEMGPLTIRQPLPVGGINQVSPFVLVHHAVPKYYAPGSEKPRLGPHPHRGFEPVTFIFEGGVEHRDSLGNKGLLDDGSVQWMTAGSGIIHSEGPSDAFLQRGGNLELIQLWVNLPAKDKMTAPKYQDIAADKIPYLKNEKGVKLKIVSGELENIKGPASSFTPIISVMGEMDATNSHQFNLPEGYNTLLYVLNGKVKINDGEEVEKYNLAIFSESGKEVKIDAIENSRFLLLSGEPINEPMVSHGPFVMNSNVEIHQAILDYQSGKMGELDY
jgi:quercetin 2,3-dioxygenase